MRTLLKFLESSANDRNLDGFRVHVALQHRLAAPSGEAELLAGVTEGLTNLELANRCSISERTVEKHLSHVYAKLGVERRTAAVARAQSAAREHEAVVR